MSSYIVVGLFLSVQCWADSLPMPLTNGAIDDGLVGAYGSLDQRVRSGAIFGSGRGTLDQPGGLNVNGCDLSSFRPESPVKTYGIMNPMSVGEINIGPVWSSDADLTRFTSSRRLVSGFNLINLGFTELGDAGGHRVEARGDLGDPSSEVPEPITIGLVGIGVIGLGVWGRRRKP